MLRTGEGTARNEGFSRGVDGLWTGRSDGIDICGLFTVSGVHFACETADVWGTSCCTDCCVCSRDLGSRFPLQTADPTISIADELFSDWPLFGVDSFMGLVDFRVDIKNRCGWAFWMSRGLVWGRGMLDLTIVGTFTVGTGTCMRVTGDFCGMLTFGLDAGPCIRPGRVTLWYLGCGVVKLCWRTAESGTVVTDELMLELHKVLSTSIAELPCVVVWLLSWMFEDVCLTVSEKRANTFAIFTTRFFHKLSENNTQDDLICNMSRMFSMQRKLKPIDM